MSRHTLSVLVENKPGVLTRVAGLFARRSFNIHSLAVGPTEHDEISRITVVVDVDALPLEQVTKQLNKLINVIKIVELEDAASVQRELLLVKVKADATQRTGVLEVVQLFRAHVVDVVPDTVVIERPADRASSTPCSPPWSRSASGRSCSPAPWPSAAGRARSPTAPSSA